MSQYSVGQMVSAVVETVAPFGIFVRLADDTRAYIRRRELALDLDVEPSQVVRVGDSVEAKVISGAESDKHIELSRRATLANPWLAFSQRFRQGDTISGEVKALTPRGAFVRLAAGISGFVPLDEIVPWEIKRPDEVLWIGDDIEAVITQLDVPRQRVTLSIKARMEQQQQASEIIARLSERVEATSVPTDDAESMLEIREPISPADRDALGLVMVIDDHDNLRAALAGQLDTMGYHVRVARDAKEALAQIDGERCGALLVDVNLPDGYDGLEFVRRARADGCQAALCVMSGPDELLVRAAEIDTLDVAQVFTKPLDFDEIDGFLRSRARGEVTPARRRLARRQSNDDIFTAQQFFRDASPIAMPHAQRLNAALGKIMDNIGAETAILFAMEPTTRTLSVVANANAKAMPSEALYALRDSPVKDVIVSGEPVSEGRASKQASYRKLVEWLPCESVIGVPIEVMGKIRHAAFFVHPKSDAVKRGHVLSAISGGFWLGAILEAQMMEEHLREASPMLLSGELSLSFAHEVYNKITSIELTLAKLTAGLTRTDGAIALSDMRAATLDLRKFADSFQQMTRTKETITTIDINTVIQQAESLLRAQLRKDRVRFVFTPMSGLPCATGNEIALRQVAVNIMLNAAQLMTRKPLGERVLTVTTSDDLNDSHLPIKIRFSDTGPGIHHNLWEKVFYPGFSTRGGSGMGLFIARSFVHSLGGIIKVEQSAVPLGTTFLVALPCVQQEASK